MSTLVHKLRRPRSQLTTERPPPLAPRVPRFRSLCDADVSLVVLMVPVVLVMLLVAFLMLTLSDRLRRSASQVRSKVRSTRTKDV